MEKRVDRRSNDADENMSVSDGLSLEQGSAAYKELVAERAGLDDDERARQIAGKQSEFSVEDMQHTLWEAGNAAHRATQLKKRAAGDRGHQTMMDRSVLSQQAKLGVWGNVAEAASEVLTTGPKPGEEEEYAKKQQRRTRRIPEEVYNMGVSEQEAEEEWFPGSRTLNKYC